MRGLFCSKESLSLTDTILEELKLSDGLSKQGRGYRIASYDNSEIKLDDNYYAYRLS